jgi:L,D-peptidoglycan transpeptidase YkuD (ErfK/YbiS/YcfS/YnhG family)
MPEDRAYNRLVALRPAPATSEEGLQRADSLYDILVEIGFNDRPVVRGRGSGIFWHGARPGFTPTAGCVATTLHVLARLAPFLNARTRIVIGEGYPRVRIRGA